MGPPNFDPVARPYRFLEYASFGLALWHRRVAFLQETRVARRVLMAGEGDGRFLAAFLAANPEAKVDYIDASASMTALARRRSAPFGDRVRLYTGDARTHPFPANHYDLIVTHFFLDCFLPVELPALIESLSAAAEPSARWLVSEFRIPLRGFAARVAGLLIGGLYRFFGAATGLRARRLPAYAPLLEASGFRQSGVRHGLGGILTSELWTRRPGLLVE